MEQENKKPIKVDVMLSNIDQRDFISFYSFVKNPMQKGFMFAVLIIGLVVILFRDRGLPDWAGGIGALAMIVLLIIIWKQRNRASKAAQATWIVKNRLRILVLDDTGIAEWDPEATDYEDEYEEDDENVHEEAEDECEYEYDEENDDYDDEDLDGDNDDAEKANKAEGSQQMDESEAVDEGDVPAIADKLAEREGADTDESDEPDRPERLGQSDVPDKLIKSGELGKLEDTTLGSMDCDEQQGRIVREGTWDSFPNAYENNKHFYIFLNDLEAFILQKTRMSEELIREVRTLIKEKMGDRFQATEK